MFLNILEVDDLIGIYAQITVIAGFILGTIYLFRTQSESFFGPVMRSTFLTLFLYVLGFIFYTLFEADEFVWLVFMFMISYHIPTLLLYAIAYFTLIRILQRFFQKSKMDK